MILDLTLLPTNVSFYGIEVKEVGCASTNATCYFAEPSHTNLWIHSPAQGSDVWTGATMANQAGSDAAGTIALLSPWGIGGQMTWRIPNVYREKGIEMDGIWFCDTNQKTTLYADGSVWIEKFGWIAGVSTNRMPIKAGRIRQ